MTTPDPKERPSRKVEAVVEETASDAKSKVREVWEHPTTKRVVRNSVKFGIIGTAYTVADEVISWGQDKS